MVNVKLALWGSSSSSSQAAVGKKKKKKWQSALIAAALLLFFAGLEEKQNTEFSIPCCQILNYEWLAF